MFTFHKLLFIVGFLLTIIYDISKSNLIRNTFQQAALLNGFNFQASSEWQGTSIRNIRLNLMEYDWKERFQGLNMSSLDLQVSDKF